MLYTCGVCGNDKNNVPFTAKEMMFGLRHTFDYFKCAQCGCLQIAAIPTDMNLYYPENYYSLQPAFQQGKKKLRSKIADFLVNQSISYQIGNCNIAGWLAQQYNPGHYKDPILWMDKRMNKMARVLDIGCGSGSLLRRMKAAGFKNLTGIDPYLSVDVQEEGLSIYSKDITTLEGEYDYIMLHHSFEHMSNPHQVFAKLNSLLAKGGTALIRIPVVDSYAWRKYGMDWFQVDAPRHFFLHTVKSLNYLAQKYEFSIEHVFYDSLAYQISISEKYIRDIPFFDKTELFSPKETKLLKEIADRLNNALDGDRACFYLKKK